VSPVARVVRAGIAAALVVALAGWVLERSRFGATQGAALARVQADVQRQFDAADETLLGIAARVANERETIGAAARDATAARRLFDAVDAALPAEDTRRTGITIYDATGTPLAWAGRVSDLTKDQIDGPSALFVAPGTLGPRLLRIEPVVEAARRQTSRSATIVVEHALRPVQSGFDPGDSLTLPTVLAPVRLRVPAGIQPTETAGRLGFVIRSADGTPLVDAEVLPSDLAAARSRWRRGTGATVAGVLALTLLLCTGPLIELRRTTRAPRVNLLVAAGIAVIVIVARGIVWSATTLVTGPRPLTSPIDLLLNALVAAALVWLGVDLLEQRRFARPRARVLADGLRSASLIGIAYLATGVADAVVLWVYERFLQAVVTRTTLDLLHFSLHPIDATRLALAFGLVLLHAAVIWAAAAIARLPTLLWRTSPGRLRRLAVLSWCLGVVVGVWFVRSPAALVPPAPLLVAIAAAGACAAMLGRVRGRSRRVSQAARLGALFVALVVPAMAMYPSLVAFAIQAKERLIATEYGPQALSQRDDLQERMRHTLDEIDALPSFSELLATAPDASTADTDRAFIIWSQTDLARFRLTSSVELYGRDGRLVSRFALNLPDTTATYSPTGCTWDLSDEVSPFASGERHVLRASRGVCSSSGTLGGVIVRAMLDYRTLPFISSESSYLESLREDRPAPMEGVSGRDIEFVVYGWSRAPLNVTGTSAWPLPDAVFERMVQSRTPIWATIDRDDERFRVYLLNDRGGIYALGYPVITRLGHLINLAELVTLAGVLYAMLVAAATLFNTLTSRTPASGRELLREIRSSFYRKLFLAFVAGAVVPVAILALATRQYFANQFRSGIEESAARTATVAQRLVEDYATLQQRGQATLEPLNDEVMVLVSQAIDEDVNLYDRSRLQATSERYLFASRLLSTRTPSDVYRRILLDHLPTYVGIQQVGGSYILAAAPVRAGGREGIVTVPLTLRQQENERQIDELDRRVLFGTLLFSLLGAALGYWMAERIADPVNRLTRATRRIARGDLDARITATSSDELRRLVEDFNQMAANLQRQRAELERTQRLEAWAEMARQVAHDIKNPLTPIQLSAEHAQRINIDRGRPLSPALDECVQSILVQVRLLRQIAAEFSSFASSPTPRPEPTSLPALLEEVVSSYRIGLSGRIAIDVEAAADLPLVTIDRTLFARALTNVIENALHAMPGTGRLTIVCRASTVGGRPSVVIEIGDSGVGMDAEALRRTFEPYFSTKATGTGLGLTIAKRNVELNGGTIEVTSARGAGTTVTIVLPVGP
jgi:signal transduction histidine kinase